jgi:alpha/beta superfamily hydrolase
VSDIVVIPGGRDVRATRDTANDTAPPETLVVACPPHPRRGGSRHDRRLQAIAEAVTEAGADCLRIDYGAYDAGRGECVDVERVVEWASKRAERVGLVGYSFGAAVALCVAARDATDTSVVDGVIALATPSQLPIAAGTDSTRAGETAPALDADDHSIDEREHAEWSAVAALSTLADSDCTVNVVYGTRDSTVETGSVVEAARSAGSAVVDVDADHAFSGRLDEVADVVGSAVDQWQ